MEGAPPVDPALGRSREIPGARDVARNTLETLLFRGLSTPVALILVVVQSRFLAPSGRGQFVLVVLSVTILSRLLGQLGLAVTNRLQDAGAEVRPLVHRAFAIGALLGALGMAAIVAWGAVTPGIGAGTAAIAAAALVPNVVWQTVSGVLLGLARVRLWNYIQALSPLLTLVGMLVLVVGLDGGVQAAVFAWTLAHFLTATFALVAARDLVLPVDVPPFLDEHGRTILRLALVMGAVQVVNLIGYRIELFLLEFYDGVAAVGVYSIAMQAAEALWLIPAAIATAITGPVVHEAEREAVATRLRRGPARARVHERRGARGRDRGAVPDPAALRRRLRGRGQAAALPAAGRRRVRDRDRARRLHLGAARAAAPRADGLGRGHAGHGRGRSPADRRVREDRRRSGQRARLRCRRRPRLALLRPAG